MKASRTRKTRFWTVYAIAAAALVVLAAVALVVFYDFIDAFDESQPQSPAEAAMKYAKEITADELRALLEDSSENISWHSMDSKEKFISERVDALDDDGMFCRRAGGDDEHPIYSLISAGHEICRIELESVPTGRYGFDCWRVKNTSACFDTLKRYEIAVPVGSTVTIDDGTVPLGDPEKSDFPFDFAPSDRGAPDYVTYTTDLRDTIPSVRAEYNGIELTLELSEVRFTAMYPNELIYSAEIRVPHGSSVTVGSYDITNTVEHATEPAFAADIVGGVNAPQYDVYTLNGLYAPLEGISITLDGRELDFDVTTDGNSEHIDCKMRVEGAQSLNAFAEEFTRAYFHYTSSGYRNIDENLAAVLKYVQTSSELYAKIRDSKIGYDFVTPVTSQVYNVLEITESYRLDDASYVTVLAFDIDHKIYSESRSYAGELILHIDRSGDGYTVLNMTIENK